MPSLTGTVRVPGDKSLSHRALLLGALAAGTTRIGGANVGADVKATATAMRALGAPVVVDEPNHALEIHGCGWDGLHEPGDVVDAGNSGTTMRLLAGLCATVPGVTVLTGDASLRRRPMLRVVAPLRQMGATIDGRAYGDLAPLTVRGGDLTGIDIALPVASAQVKSAVLLAGLRADGVTTVTEPSPSRDHTERMLLALGAPLEARTGVATVRGGWEPLPFAFEVPGDISSAMFLIAAAVLVTGSRLRIEDVGLNPSRAGALGVLAAMGAEVSWVASGTELGEPVGAVDVAAGPLQGVEVAAAQVPTLIDDVPALAIIASQAEGDTVITGARELRVKESDRIETIASGLKELGGDVEVLPDGLIVHGPTTLRGGEVDAHGDHRIALAFAVAGLVSTSRVRIKGWSSIDTSFPEFLDVLGQAQRGS